MTRRTLNLFTSVFLMLAFVVLTPERAEADASIVDRQLVSKQRVGRSSYDYTYTLSLAVNGPALDDVRVLVWCDNAGTEITDNEVVFGNVPGNSTTTSSGAEGTFTLRQNRRIPFDESCLNYNIRFVTLLKISGIATDKPLKNATVTVTNSEPVIDASGRPVVDNSGRPVVDNTTTTVTADEDGAYEAELTVTSQDDFIALTADGEVGTDQEDATLTSTVGSVGELHTVGAEGSIVVGSGDSGALNITHITTAQDELVRRLNGGVPPANDAELAALQAQVDGAELLLLATTIKTVIDNPDVMLPPGINSTLELIQQDPAVVNAYTQQLQQNFPMEFETALTETADELGLEYVASEVPGFLYATLQRESPLFVSGYEFDFGGSGDGTVTFSAGTSDILWSVNPAGEIEVQLLSPPVTESFPFRDPPGGQVRAETVVESIRLIRLANGVRIDQLFLLETTRTRFPDVVPPLPDEVDVDSPDPAFVHLSFRESGILPVVAADIANEQIALTYLHTDNLAIGLTDGVDFGGPGYRGADFLLFNADFTGVTQRRGFAFNWSIDSTGSLVVDFANGDSNRFVLFDDAEIGTAITIGTLSGAQPNAYTAKVIRYDGDTEFTADLLTDRRYRGISPILDPVTFGRVFDFLFPDGGDGCRITGFEGDLFSRPSTWESSTENYMDLFLFIQGIPNPYQRRAWQAIRVVPGVLGDRYWVIENADFGNGAADPDYVFVEPEDTPGRLNAYEFIEDIGGQFDHCGLTTYDLKNDWSDNLNPNGVWSLNAGSAPLIPVADLSSTGIDFFPTPQPGFTAQPIFGDVTPVWFRATGPLSNGNPDYEIGDIVTHTSRPSIDNSNVTWTSDIAGQIDILGGVWPTRAFGRSNDWFLYLNGSLLTSGTIGDPDPYDRANPFLFELGSGGPAAVRDIPIEVGDVVKLEFQQLFDFGEDYTGVDLRIVALPRK